MKREKEKNSIDGEESDLEDVSLTCENIKTRLGASDDMMFRDIYTGKDHSVIVRIVFADGLINGKNADDDVLRPLIQEDCFIHAKTETDVFDSVVKGGIYHNVMQVRQSLDDCIGDILSGSMALLFDGLCKAVTFEVKGADFRNVSEPSNENVIKGSKDVFVENLRVNTATIRTKIQSQNLRVIQTKIGRQTHTAAAIVYIEGIAREDVISEVKKRINAISTDGVTTAGVFEEHIIDKRFSLFPQAHCTERPDKLCANLLEGRVGILIDGLPLVYMVPTTFSMFMQAPEDYAFGYLFASMTRIIRYGALLLMVLLPAYYIAVGSFHIEMIPARLVVSIINSKANVPFTTFIEVLFMLITFELLIEAGIRLPKTIGQAMSIVGAIVLGQAAVSAELISPAVIVIIAAAGIAGFALPSHDLANTFRIVRLLLIACATIAGLVGVSLGVIAVIYYMSTIESFGVSYLSPFVGAPGIEVIGDTIIRLPLNFLKYRPRDIRGVNIKRKK